MHETARADQLAITGELPKPGEDRYFLNEIAKFLGIPMTRVKKWAASRRILHEGRGRDRNGRGWTRLYWLTERGMVQAVAHFRAKQGHEALTAWQRRLERAGRRKVQLGA